MSASGMLRSNEVIFYHPLDDFVEHTQNQAWSGSAGFVPGKIGQAKSAITTDVPNYGSVNTYGSGDFDTEHELRTIDSSHVLMAYKNHTTEEVELRIGTISGMNITWGDVYGTGDDLLGNGYEIGLAILESGKFIIGYRTDTGAGGDDNKCRIGTISGSTITFGSQYIVPSPTIARGMRLSTLDSSHVIVAYSDYNSGAEDGWVGLVTISGTTISYGSGVNFDSGIDYYGISLVGINSSGCVIEWQNYPNLSGAVITASGTNVIVGSSVALSTNARTSTILPNRVIKLTPTKVIFNYSTASVEVESKVGTISGTNITLGSPTICATTAGLGDSATLDDSHFVNLYRNDSMPAMSIGTVSGTAITFGGASSPFPLPTGSDAVDTFGITATSYDTFIAAVNRSATTKASETVVGKLSVSAAITASTPSAYPTASGNDRLVLAAWARNITKGSSDVAVQRDYRIELNGANITLGPTSVIWSGVAPMGSGQMNDDSDHLLVLDFEHIGEGNWNLNTSFDGSEWVSEGSGIGIRTIAPSSLSPKLEINNGESNQWIDELVLWGGDKSTFEQFTTQELINLYNLAEIFDRGMDRYDNITQLSCNLFISSNHSQTLCNLFTVGPRQTIASSNLLILGLQQITTSCDLFINGKLSLNNEIPNYINGFNIQSGSRSLFTFAPPPSLYDVTKLYIAGPISCNISDNLFIHGHILLNASGDLFINGYDQIEGSGNLYTLGPQRIIDSDNLFIQGHKNTNIHDHIYWTDQGTDKVQRAYLDGSVIDDLQTGLNTPKGIVLHIPNGHVYWTDPVVGYIRRCDFDGSNMVPIISGLAGNFQGIAVDVENGYLYSCGNNPDNKRIARCNLDGSNLTILLSSGMSDPMDVALDVMNNKLYWTEYTDEYIGWSTLNGSSSGILVSGLNAPVGIEIDLINDKLYWTNVKSGYCNIQRSNLDGTNIETLVSGLDHPNGLCLDINNSKIYFTETGLGTIHKCNLDGSNVETIIDGLTNPQWIATDSLPNSIDLFIRGLESLSISGNLFINGHESYITSGDLFIEGNIETHIDVSGNLFIRGHEPKNNDISLYVDGIRVTSKIYACGDNTNRSLGVVAEVDRVTSLQRAFGNLFIKYPYENYPTCWAENEKAVAHRCPTTAACTPTQGVCVDEDGRVWSVGTNTDYALGIGSTNESYVTSTPIRVSGLPDVPFIGVRIGDRTSFAIAENGTVWSWGHNSHGELGIGNTANQHTAQQVSGIIDTIDIDVSDHHAVFVTSSGVYACGDYTDGRLGISGVTENVLIPQQVSGLNGLEIVDVACGNDTTMFLIANGDIYFCGKNNHGLFGNGTAKNTVWNIPTLSISGILYDCPLDITCDTNSSAFICGSGCIHCAGYNRRGKFGNGTTTGDYINFIKIEQDTPSGINIRMGDEASWLSCRDFASGVWAAGGSNDGEVGTTEDIPWTSWQQVPNSSGYLRMWGTKKQLTVYEAVVERVLHTSDIVNLYIVGPLLSQTSGNLFVHGHELLEYSRSKLYWTDRSTNNIRKCNLDGSNVEILITGLPFPRDIAIDSYNNKMYWVDSESDKIQRANLDGSDIEVLVSGLNIPAGIAIDIENEKIYFTDVGTNKIQKANLDGSDIENLITVGLNAPIGIKLDVQNGKMYFVNQGIDKIQKANLDGSIIEDVITTGLDWPAYIELDLDHNKIYWTDFGTDKIQKANLDGSDIENVIVTGLDFPHGLTIDSQHGKIYWVDHGTDKIQRANLDGSNKEDILTSGLIYPDGIDIESGDNQGIQLFTSAKQLHAVSGDLYINGHMDILVSGDLFIKGHIDTSGIPAPSLFIHGHIGNTISGTLFAEGHSDIIASGNLFIHGPELSLASGNLFTEGHYGYDVIQVSSDLYIDAHEPHSTYGNLYINGYLITSASGDSLIWGYEPFAISGNLYIYGHIINSGNSTLYLWGHELIPKSCALFIHGHENILMSGNLFIEGHVDASSVPAPSFFIHGHEQYSSFLGLGLYTNGLSPFSTWTISPRIDWLLRTHDYNPQIIGLLDSAASSVTIEIWDITDGVNISVTLTDSTCYPIGTTSRWGWSTANLPPYRGYKKHYFYRMISNIGDTFEGQFLLDVPESARWIHPSQQSEYIK